MRIGSCAFVAALLIAGFAADTARAGDQTSTSFILRAAHFNNGGNGALVSTAPGSLLGVVGATVGQSHPLTPAGSATTLRTVWPGFWPLFGGAFPSLDIDADLRPTFNDNCPWWGNPGQTPSLDDPSIGLACLCGDVSDDGTVLLDDDDEYRAALADPFGAPVTAPEKCTVRGDPGACSILDRVVVARALSSFAPLIDQRCEAALPP